MFKTLFKYYMYLCVPIIKVPHKFFDTNYNERTAVPTFHKIKCLGQDNTDLNPSVLYIITNS